MRCYAGADCFLASWLQAPNSGSSSLRRSPTRESRDPTPPCTSSHPVCRGSVTEIGRNQRGPSRIKQKGRKDREARQASPFRTSRPSCSNVRKRDRLGFAVPYLRALYVRLCDQEGSGKDCCREWASKLVGGSSPCHGDFGLGRANLAQGRQDARAAGRRARGRADRSIRVKRLDLVAKRRSLPCTWFNSNR
jgi:hypothetical protein